MSSSRKRPAPAPSPHRAASAHDAAKRRYDGSDAPHHDHEATPSPVIGMHVPAHLLVNTDAQTGGSSDGDRASLVSPALQRSNAVDVASEAGSPPPPALADAVTESPKPVAEPKVEPPKVLKWVLDPARVNSNGMQRSTHGAGLPSAPAHRAGAGASTAGDGTAGASAPTAAGAGALGAGASGAGAGAGAGSATDGPRPGAGALAGAGSGGAPDGAAATPTTGSPAVQAAPPDVLTEPVDDPCGVQWFSDSFLGMKPTQEDRVSNGRTVMRGVHVRYFGVYDGHGGPECAEFLVKKLPNSFVHYHTQNLARASSAARRARSGGATADDPDTLKQSIVASFHATDAAFLDIARRRKSVAGSTCLVAMLVGNTPGSMVLHVANTGDCRAVLCRGGSPLRLSDDHKPNRADERKRILKAGGAVDGYGRRTLLSVSRTFGDVSLKEPSPLVIATPDVRHVKLQRDDVFLVLACDGIWDVLSDDDVVEVALPHADDPEAAAKAIVKAAFQRSSEDNLTVTVVRFPWNAGAVAPAVAARNKAAAAAKAASEEEVDMFA